MPDRKWVFVSLSTCGHAQSVYADTPGVPWKEAILDDLRAGLTVKRVTFDDYRANYSKHLMCGCATVGHEMDATLEAKP